MNFIRSSGLRTFCAQKLSKLCKYFAPDWMLLSGGQRVSPSYFKMVAGINCISPRAPAHDSAFGLNPDSTKLSAVSNLQSHPTIGACALYNESNGERAPAWMGGMEKKRCTPPDQCSSARPKYLRYNLLMKRAPLFPAMKEVNLSWSFNLQ